MPTENIAVSPNAASEAWGPDRQAKGMPFMHAAADKWGDTAAYFREHDIDGMLLDLGRALRAYPGPTLIAAGVVGFLLGRTWTRRA